MSDKSKNKKASKVSKNGHTKNQMQKYPGFLRGTKVLWLR